MALGKRRDEQQEMWVATTNLPKSQGHVFYRKLNQLLAEEHFDRTVEEMVAVHSLKLALPDFGKSAMKVAWTLSNSRKTFVRDESQLIG